jgi:hypothetical protein
MRCFVSCMYICSIIVFFCAFLFLFSSALIPVDGVILCVRKIQLRLTNPKKIGKKFVYVGLEPRSFS